MKLESDLERLDRLVGRWTTEATHPAFPGVIVTGTVDAEWLEGRRFLAHRSRFDHPDFPSSLAIIGDMGRDRAEQKVEGSLSMHYFDSRGVFRVYDVTIDDDAWRLVREAPGFSQRFEGKLSGTGDTITGIWELSEDDSRWRKDLEITYRRR
jgi:hypothetical protein